MQESKYNFIFLLYVSRSGSTFLAKQLADQCEDLAVIPESQYLRTFLADFKYGRKYNGAKLSKLIMEDSRFSGFGISESIIKKTLLKCRDHKEAIEAITGRIIKFLGIPSHKNVLIKDGGLINFVDDAKIFFPNLKLLHIHRDPRACISSLLNSPKAFIKGNSSMGWNDIEMCSKQYKNYINKIKSVENNNTVITVRYEALIENTSEIIIKTIRDLGLIENNSKEDKQWDHLRKQENEIHKNINKPAQKKRTDAWKDELKKWEKIYIEKHLREFIELRSVKYSMYELILVNAKAKKNHLIAISKLNSHRIKRYILSGNLDLLLLKLKTRVLK